MDNTRAACIAFLAFASLAIAVEAKCQISAGGQTIDVTELQASQYLVFSGGVARYDRFHRGHSGQKYLYFINFCKNVDRVGMNESSCNEKQNSAAYQVTRESRYHPPVCFSLGRNEKIGAELIDNDEPEKGIKLVYGGGEDCHKRVERVNETGHTNIEWDLVERKFEVQFICEEGFGTEPAHFLNMATERDVAVTEDEQCTYTLKLPTHLACGTQSSWGAPSISFGIGWKTVFFLFLVAMVGVNYSNNPSEFLAAADRLKRGFQNPLVIKSVLPELLLTRPMRVKLGLASGGSTSAVNKKAESASGDNSHQV